MSDDLSAADEGDDPLGTGSNGRDQRSGRFLAGNKAAVGRVNRQARLRSLFYDCVTDDDFREVVAVLVREAKAGDAVAIRELLTRLIGRPGEDADHAERIEQLEGALAALRETEGSTHATAPA
jgi:hypothetical protein